ncbi:MULTISPECIES: ArsR/SmtB family transcription factor [Marinobacter]|uniref:ArsR/SmtB family transcription factor n=1 Tax=Marinobacter TaxID=2742 RepID=UPI001D06CBBC|nr:MULTISPECIES: metalloregulator ArsR/SmtB family transcription factor [Marinobacter]MCK7564999.1 metalloregulator ArsR/SmtB family transcription factor [Marinobacter xestospongiae]UDL05784.1 winged helix-turn-helix transcriptional regulator [Marinobacter sp. CA1]
MGTRNTDTRNTDTRNQDHLCRAFKALANPTRLRIYQQIRDQRSGEVADSGCKLVDFINSLKVGAPTVSHHLKELVNAGLIEVRRDGRFLTCYLREDMREELRRFWERT